MHHLSSTSNGNDDGPTKYLPVLDSNLKNVTPEKGQEFASLEDAYNFYNEYARKMGFSVRKHYANKHKVTKEVTSRRFICNKEGGRAPDKRDHLTTNPRAETRVFCEARMTVSLNRSRGTYKVIDFVPDHNHLLHLPCCAHMMPSQRKMTDAHIIQIDMADDSGINPKETHGFMGRQAGGRDNLGHTLLDHRNYLHSKRQKNLQYGEVGTLLRYFQQQTLENQAFFYRVQLDEDELITNIFWADPKMIADYAYFGDVVTFDTTFGTNKENRPFGVFVGFNHHRETVIFGAALLYDEKIPSFEWLFETFLEAHHKKKPITIFTDQDTAMASAISSKMSGTRHGLCVWHIMHNCNTHLGHLAKEENNILQDFKSCMYNCEEVEEFDEKWQAFLVKHDLFENTWIPRIYGLREKWAAPYMKTTFSVGMRSTQLSESLNSTMKDYLKSDLDLPRFFHHFERAVSDRRYKELEAEYNCRQKLPKIKMKKSPILNQVAQVYTTKIFDLFQEEYDEYQGAFVRSKEESDQTTEYVIAIVGKAREYKVFGNSVNKTVSCGCRKFETMGILCSHALKVLDVMDIKMIPDQYIIKRWTRDARSANTEYLTGLVIENPSKLETTERYRALCPSFVKMISKAAESVEASTFLANEFSRLNITVEGICTNSTACSGTSETNTHIFTSRGAEENNQMNDATLHRAKGLKKKTSVKGSGGKRHKSWHEKACRTAITSKTTNNNDFSSSQEKDISQVIGQSHYAGLNNVKELFLHENQQSYTDLLLNGVHKFSQQLFVGESQMYPSSN